MIVFHISIWGAWSFVWGISPPSLPVATGLPTKDLSHLDKSKPLHAPCLKQDKKASGRCVKAMQALCTLWLPWKAQQIHVTMCFTNNDKKRKFAAESKSDIRKLNYGIYVATCVICHQQYVSQTVNKFSTGWSSHPSNWNKPDNWMTATKWPYHCTIQCSMTS